MHTSIDDFDFAINCPHCDQEIEKTLAEFEKHNPFACHACSTEILLDKNILTGMRKKAADLDKQFRALNTSIDIDL